MVSIYRVCLAQQTTSSYVDEYNFDMAECVWVLWYASTTLRITKLILMTVPWGWG